MFRYVIFIWDTRSAQQSEAVAALQRNLSGTASAWSMAFECAGARVWVAGDSLAGFSVSPLCSGAGVVLGEIFVRHKDVNRAAAADDARFNRFETREILKSKGRSLVRDFWGNFAAFVVDEAGDDAGTARGGRYVVKDPCGSLPCHFAELRGVQVVFSCLEDVRRIGLALVVNWNFVRARAVHGFLDMDIPALIGVSTVHRGECVEFDRRGKFVERALYWHPSSFAHVDELITEAAEAARGMRATLRSCVHSMARHHARALAQVSGGLDSSIILGILGEAPSHPEVTCYTVYTQDSVSDERRWARHAMERAGHRHVEFWRDPRAIAFRDFSRMAPTVEPGCYYTAWQRGPLERELAAEVGATATFTGESGDSTLCATTFSFATDHCLRRHGLGMRTFRTALAVAARRDRTIWQVLAKSVGREWLGAGRADERRRRASFNRLVSSTLTQAAGGGAVGAEPNIWSKEARISEETRQRLGALAFPPEFYDLSTSAEDAAPYSLVPMCAQPMVELCLRIPVDTHFEGGRSRGLARRAFADVVPVPILRRQWKDHPVLFFGELVRNNLPFLREHLLDGALVRQGILNRAAVELALESGPTLSAAVSGELYSHLDLELWIRDCAGA
jgi:asparagine synthase (glutamine-hydrolysing)